MALDARREYIEIIWECCERITTFCASVAPFLCFTLLHLLCPARWGKVVDKRRMHCLQTDGRAACLAMVLRGLIMVVRW